MPLSTMKPKWKGLGPKIGGSAENPRATAIVIVEDVDDAHNEADIIKKVIEWIASEGFTTVKFFVPNPTGLTPYEWTLLHLKSVDPEVIGHRLAVADVEWNLVKATPTQTTDPLTGATKRPSETSTSEILGPEYSFDTSGGTKHVTQAVFVRSAQKVGGAGNFSAPDVKGAIGVSHDKVEGCDVVTGDLKWAIKVKGVPVTAEYIDMLVELTGTVNTFEWFGRGREDLLFLGAAGAYKAGDAWEVQYSFHQGKTRTNVEIIPGVVVPEIRGHDHVDVGGYVKTVVGGFSVTTPTMVYVNQVYERNDFDRLGI